MKLLIVGLGSMGKRRARLIGSLGGHSVTGVDATPERRSEAEGLGILCHASIPAALAGATFDAAFVCTAPLAHAAIIDELLEAGLPVFTELNLVADGYEALMAKAEAKGLPLFLSSTMLYRAEVQRIIEAVARHGRPTGYTYHIGQYLPDWHPWESYKNFFVGSKRSGGVREIFGIELPWLVTAFGPVTGLAAQHSRLTTLELPYPDSSTCLLRHAGGTTGTLTAEVASPKAVRHFECFGEGLQLLWEGRPDSLMAWDAGEKQMLPLATYERFEQDARYSDNIVENAYLDEILDFFALLEGRATPRWSFGQDLEVLRLIDRIEQEGRDA